MNWNCCLSGQTADNVCRSAVNFDPEDKNALKGRLIETCLYCVNFKETLGKGLDDKDVEAEIISTLSETVISQKKQLESLSTFLSTKTSEIRFLHELGSSLQTSMNLDEVLSVGLTAITAGQGFGFNRAFLLLLDRETETLKGHLGVGPKDIEEAWKIWSEINQAGANLESLASDLQKRKLKSEREKFKELLNSLTVSISDEDHPFVAALNNGRPLLIENANNNPVVSSELYIALGVNSFVIVPLISVYRKIGVIIADNFVTKTPISPQDLLSLETFAFPLAFAIERASLYEKIQDQVNQLTIANARLKEQQDLLLKMEKMALIGRITSSISHSIRNPLMVMGGFARSLLKNIEKEDPKREYLEMIVKEAKQLENVLEEVLSYSDSLYPALDYWEINQLVDNVVDELKLLCSEHGVSVSRVSEEQFLTVYIDYKKIAYCVRSVLSYSVENSLNVSSVEIKTGRDDGTVFIIVTDNGSLPEENLSENRLTPFSETVELGSGLGLPLCKSILERYGNHFQIEYIPGTGIRYSIRIHSLKEE